MSQSSIELARFGPMLEKQVLKTSAISLTKFHLLSSNFSSYIDHLGQDAYCRLEDQPYAQYAMSKEKIGGEESDTAKKTRP